jgi:hypothetical protein
VCCITCQKLKFVEVEEVQEDSGHDTDWNGSLGGGSPINFSGDEVVQKGKEGNKNIDEEGDENSKIKYNQVFPTRTAIT